jgi:hypothetical protein
MPFADNRNVFINCPFDDAYLGMFRASIFTVLRSGFKARCALELDDGGDNRFERICRIISECRLAVHDISRTESSGDPPLPRFNMPFELGLFLGAKKLGSIAHRGKRCIIFDVERYRYQRYISDIAGQDIHAHGGDPQRLIAELAAWLRDFSGDRAVPGGAAIAADYAEFNEALPAACQARALDPAELTFGDFNAFCVAFLTR